MYEYKIIKSRRTRKLQQILNELAEEGWKVTCPIHGCRIVLRRTKREE